jgi:septal ring factor EnvC (AmiA/AmiB activator)
MRGSVLVLLLTPALAASALAQDVGPPLDTALKQAEAEQAAAEAQTARLEQAAFQAKGEADRLHEQQAAAAQAIDAGEARISAANVRLQLASAQIAAYRQRLAVEQQPVSSLLAGLAMMARRPPLLVLANRGSTDELVEVRLLLDSTLPVIRSRTSQLSAQLSQGERLRQATLTARAELARSRDDLVARRQRFTLLEQKAMQQALASGGQALGTGDVAIATAEDVQRLRSEQANNQSIRRVADQLAEDDASPPNPFAPDGGTLRPPFAYDLPAAAAVTDGLDSVNENGVQSRGITLATTRGAEISAPADGVIKFSGPFHDYDGVVIIDHGAGWLSLIVNAASPLHPGDRVVRGQEIGRALGPLQVELSQNGRRMSPALIAGSSQNLSKGPKGG